MLKFTLLFVLAVFRFAGMRCQTRERRTARADTVSKSRQIG